MIKSCWECTMCLVKPKSYGATILLQIQTDFVTSLIFLFSHHEFLKQKYWQVPFAIFINIPNNWNSSKSNLKYLSKHFKQNENVSPDILIDSSTLSRRHREKRMKIHYRRHINTSDFIDNNGNNVSASKGLQGKRKSEKK